MKETKLAKLKDYGDLLVPRDLCRILGIGMNKAYELLQTDEIRHFKIGRAIRIPKRYVIEYIEKCVTKKDASDRQCYSICTLILFK